MTSLSDHTRSMISYNRWANERILRAAAGLPPEGFDAIRKTMNHVLGTQRYWYANWTHTEFAEPDEQALENLRSEYEASHADLLLFCQRLDDDEWQRGEPWWKQWGYEDVVPIGETLFQVVYHGIQHRAEVAEVLTQHDCSPGDMDFLNFLQETRPS